MHARIIFQQQPFELQPDLQEEDAQGQDGNRPELNLGQLLEKRNCTAWKGPEVVHNPQHRPESLRL